MSDFHDVRFPLHLAFGTRGGPVRQTDILQLANGTEVRNAKTRHSRRRYNAVAGLKKISDTIDLLQFFESRFGSLYGFRFRDPLDYSAVSTLGVGTGEDTEFPMTKTYGTAPHTYVRRITKPVVGTVVVSVDKVITPVFVDYDKGLIRFETPPDNGAIITAEFEFDVPVRFATDSLDIELDDFGSTQIQDIPLIEILPFEDVET